MAVVTNLFHVTGALGAFIKEKLATTVVLAPPPDAVLTTEEVRVSLVYVSEQATHRNDGYERRADGRSMPPPLTLSVFYMITAYGEAPSGDAEAAHRLLGAVVRALHDEPVLDLTALGIPGEGQLGATLVPMTPEVMEKLFSPLQIKHRPFLFYELGPVQLKSDLPLTGLGAIVAPDGLRLAGPTLQTTPVIARVVPRRPVADGFVRIDGSFGGAADAVTVGTTRFRAADGDFVPVDPAQPDRGVRLQLPAALVRPGTHQVTITAGQVTSLPVEIEVQAAGARVLDGPATFSHSQASTLVLTGQGLADVDEVFFWPDRGVFDPSDVVSFPASSPSSTSVEVNPTNLRPGLYRLAARLQIGAGTPKQFTPFIVLEIEP